MNGGLAQLARAPALQAGGQRFESVILHPKKGNNLFPILDILYIRLREKNFLRKVNNFTSYESKEQRVEQKLEV